VSSSVLAQTAGDLRVPSYLTDAPASQLPTVPNRAGDPADAFRAIPGLPYQRPTMAGPGKRAAGLTYGFFGGVDTSYTDNALLTGNGLGASDDLLVTTSVGVRLGYAITDQSSLDVNLGVSYRYSMNYQSFTQFNLVPNSTLAYRLLVGDVMLNFYNRTTSGADYRSELAGNGSASAVNLNRLSNSSGLTGIWAPTKDVSVSAGYSYDINRGLEDSFAILDQDTHSLSAAVYDRLSPYWTVGLSAGASFTSYAKNFQNDSTGYSAGPMVSFSPNDYITISASVRYQIVEFSTSGTVGDRRNFGGPTWNLSASQILTPHLTHSATVSSGVTSGLGSNFTESLSAGYTLGWQFMKNVGLNASFTYTDVKQSGRSSGLFVYQVNGVNYLVPVTVTLNDSAVLYDFHVGTGYQFSPNLRGSIGYSHIIRDSTFATRGYHANTVSVGVGISF